MGLTVSRKKRCFFSDFLLSTVKTFQGISNLTISADLHGLLAHEETLQLCYILK